MMLPFQRYLGSSQTTTSIAATGFLQAPLLSEMHGELVDYALLPMFMYLFTRAILHDEVCTLIL
jgi:hypothetical protein